MYIFHHIELSGVGPFKKKMKFEVPTGVSVIYGLNRASGKASKNSNGVGKSFMWGMIPEIVYDLPSVGEKSDRVRQGSRELAWTTHGGKKIIVRRAQHGKSEKLSVTVNGKDKELRTLPIARNFMRKMWPISPEEYNTYVSIDSRVPHPLVMGSGAERKRFMTAFFNLDKLDAERKLYAAELSKLSKVRAAYSELRVQVTRMREDLLSPEALVEAKAKADKLRLRLKKMQAQFTEAQETIRLVSFATSAQEQIETLRTAMCGDITEEGFAEFVANNKWEREKVTKELEDAEAWDKYRSDNSRYIEVYNALSDAAKALLKEKGTVEAKADAEAGYESYLKFRAQVQKLEADIQELQDEAAAKLPPLVEKPAEDESDLGTLSRAYAHQLDHAEKFSEGKCETCGQVVKIKDPSILRKKLKEVDAKIRAHRQYREYTEAKAVKDKARFKIKAWTNDADRMKEKMADSKALAKIHKELMELPRKPKAFTGKKLETKVLKRVIEEVNERRLLLKYLEPHLETIIEFQKLTEADLQKVKASEEIGDRMNAVQEQLSVVQASIEMHRAVRSRVKEAQVRLAEMKAQLEDEEPLKHLVHGFQDKNIKKMAIEAISQRLMVLVNRYASRVFPEPFRFEFQWDSEIKILVHRPGSEEPTDVRRLSGAESVIFTLILVCSLLNFVPHHKRCSMMILDEPSARMSTEMTEVMYNMVKILNTMIPSIVIVTPKSEEIYAGAKAFTVIKRNGYSEIVEGFPSQVK